MTKSREGFAFVAVVWLMVGISAALLDFSLRLRHRRLALQNAVESAQLRAAASGAIEQALWSLERELAARTDSAKPLALQLTEHHEKMGSVTVHVSRSDVQSQLNINNSPPYVVDRFLTQFVASNAAVGAAMLDWTDADDADRNGGGGERARYAAASLPVRPANAPFHRASELCGVIGVAGGDCIRMQPLVTVHGDGRINLNTAPAEVLLALPGFSQPAVAELLEQRSRGEHVYSIYSFSQTLDSAVGNTVLAQLTELIRHTVTQTSVVIITATARGSAQLEVSERVVVDLSVEAPIVVARRVE